MEGMKEMISSEYERLFYIRKNVIERLEKAPEGTLIVKQEGKNIKFYHKLSKEGLVDKQYISKENYKLFSELAQKSYDEKILRKVDKRIKQLKNLVDEYEDNEIESVFYEENEVRQQLITPVEQPWRVLYEEWANQEFNRKAFEDGTPVIMTNRGERVRSKSEKIMADYFADRGIYYHYEKPLYLNGVGYVYPDFTFFSRKTGREVYWEHNGRMDDPMYTPNTIRKMNAYVCNGIFIGENLLVTYETSKVSLDMSIVEKLVDKYLI